MIPLVPFVGFTQRISYIFYEIILLLRMFGLRLTYHIPLRNESILIQIGQNN
ncbi:hypothetical protein Golob_020705 [Gossypium lobatum]|uniref:Uncharacterized protein n=1 Tax=Gossypium lobatum TaxID=34289 RepID=A0A7J8LB75_9ROSI|nr:hypothetical protein [Gossypium lobatum]